MKYSIIALTSLLGCAVSAQADLTVAQSALRALMAKNPIAVARDGTATPTNTLIAGNIISSFTHGVGSLAVSTNKCGSVSSSGIAKCELSIAGSDRDIDAGGAYVKADEGTEWRMLISYSYSVRANSIVDKSVKFSVAD